MTAAAPEIVAPETRAPGRVSMLKLYGVHVRALLLETEMSSHRDIGACETGFVVPRVARLYSAGRSGFSLSCLPERGASWRCRRGKGRG